MSDTPVEEQAPAEGGVVTEEAGGEVVEAEGVGIEPLLAGGAAPVTNWQSWVAQQGGIQPTTVNPPPYPPSTSGGTPGTMFPGILPQTGLISGANSTPVYPDIPTYVKPADLYQGWTAQVPNFMVVQPYPPAAVLISQVTPRSGAGATNVTIQGQGFTGATAVNIGGAATNVVVVNDTTITCTTAAVAAGTTVSASVTTPRGVATLPNAYTGR